MRWQTRIVGAREHRLDAADLFRCQTSPQLLEHLRLNVCGIDAPARLHAPCELYGVVPRSRAHVRHDVPGLHADVVDGLVRLFLGVPLGTIEPVRSEMTHHLRDVTAADRMDTGCVGDLGLSESRRMASGKSNE